jgi:hypothetical protein
MINSGISRNTRPTQSKLAGAFFFIVSLALLFTSGKVQAQEELEEYYIPPASSVFGSNSTDVSEKDGDENYPVYSIRFIPTTLARNIISFEYEKSLSETFSVGLVGGYCLGKSYIQTETIGLRDYSGDGSKLSPDEMLRNSSPDGGGLVVGAYLRIYVDSYYNENDRFWEIQFRKWSYGFDVDGYDAVEGNSRGRLSNNFIGLLWGLQSFAGKKDNFIVDSKLGIGLNLGTYDSFDIEEDFFTGEYYYSKSTEERFMVPMFYYSIALGFAKYSK